MGSPKLWDHLPNVESSPTLQPPSRVSLMESTMFCTLMPSSPKEIWSILHTKLRESLAKSPKLWDHLPNVESSPTLQPPSRVSLMESTMFCTLMPSSPKEIWLIMHTKLRESLVKSPRLLDHLPNVEPSPTLPNKYKDLLMESTMFF